MLKRTIHSESLEFRANPFCFQFWDERRGRKEILTATSPCALKAVERIDASGCVYGRLALRPSKSDRARGADRITGVDSYHSHYRHCLTDVADHLRRFTHLLSQQIKIPYSWNLDNAVIGRSVVSP